MLSRFINARLVGFILTDTIVNSRRTKLMVQELEKKIVSVVQKVIPSVVSVSVTKMAQVALSRVA